MSVLLKHIMTPNPQCVSTLDNLIVLKHIYEKRNFHHHIPVTDGGKVIGMISLIDFMRAIGNATLEDNEPVYKKSVKEIMTQNVVSLEQNLPIDEAVKIFLKNEIHAIPVMNKERIVGIITTNDLLKYFYEKENHLQTGSEIG